MNTPFQLSSYYGYIIKGDLLSAVQYANRHPELAEEAGKYREIFEQEKYPPLPLPEKLSSVLTLYHKYYRDVFYLCLPPEEAEENLRRTLGDHLQLPAGTLEDIESHHLPQLFRDHGLSFLGGRTGGYFGPYVWRNTESRTYAVELPSGIQNYTVQLLDGFLSRSWIDFLSFGAIGTGGWTGSDGMIHCIRDSYDLNSENFTVSLLKHEAQHTMDLTKNANMSPTDLEYRAKLVELIYSSQRNLLPQYLQEADANTPGHPQAAARIIEGFRHLHPNRSLESLPVSDIQATAAILFSQSDP